MALTVTNTNTFQLLSILNRTSAAQNKVLTQLSTGLRINKGADDPAGLIALKSLEAEITATDAALSNNQRTNAVLNVADSALGEIGSLLNEINSLVVASSSDANLSASERAANQAQIDLAIQSIDRIVRTTSFNGTRLIDGSGSISNTVSSAGAVQDVKIFSRGNITSDLALTINLTTAAANGTYTLAAMSSGATSGATEIAITGSLGTTTVTIASGTAVASAAAIINQATDTTGVTATVSGAGSSIILSTSSTGSANFITVDVLSGGAVTDPGGTAFTSTTTKISGTDAQGFVNGQSFSADGSKVSFNVGGVSGSFSIGSTFVTDANQTLTVQTTGGFTFQLGTEASTRATIGVDGLFSHQLGGGDSGGFLSQLGSGGSADLSSSSSRATALNVVREAISDLSIARGRIGGFQKFQVQPSINSLAAAKVGLSDAASVIGDTDYALATAELNKQSVLLNTSISLLGLANQQAAQILALLG